MSSSLIEVFSLYVYPALLVLFFFGLTIFVHELGHFLVAKRRKMIVERFSIGFGPKIFGWEKDRKGEGERRDGSSRLLLLSHSRNPK